MPGQPVPAVGVAEGLAEVGGGCPVPQVRPAGGGGRGDRLVLWPGGPGAGAAAEPGQQGQGVAAVPEPGRVGPRARAGWASVARSMPGSRPVARLGGGGPPWASMSTRTSPEGPAATPGTARGSRLPPGGDAWRGRWWRRGRRGTSRPRRRQGQAWARWAGRPCRGRQAGQLARGRLLAGDSGRMCQPSAARSSASRAGSLDAGMGVLRGGLEGGRGMPTGHPPRGRSGAGRRGRYGRPSASWAAGCRHPPPPGAAGPVRWRQPGEKWARVMSHMSHWAADLGRWWDSAMSHVGHQGHDRAAGVGHVGHRRDMAMSHFSGPLTCGDAAMGHVGHVFFSF